ncbi:MAG: DUF2063 domain-containing protein [Cycloclasticus sp.]|nr:DUF2063 domain-containing protein [Cycloclasticus sp.]MBG96744.1 DUF2063 domain-containing protein [Cycloclasticus sp.]HAI96468.1 DUF2063 domain-containing protein [Methylococcaceae bacterium]|tara:strand:- start:1703 stop:2470 length:768 start_codon:yes stop_codon:yes gene_type:complete
MPQDNTPSFIQTQHEFTRYIRDPKNANKPADIEERRLNIYRDLLFTNISNVLSDGFPVLRKLHSEQQWANICQDFYHRHPSKSPYFADISQEFIQYLQNERANSATSNTDFPFLLELAHYEWIELVISIAEETTNNLAITDPINQTLTIAPTALAVAYTYPVHKISPDFLPSAPPEHPTYLTVYRDTENKTGFLETNAMTHALLTALTNNTHTVTNDILFQLAQHLQHPKPEIVIEGGLSILNDFIQRGIVISTD